MGGSSGSTKSTQEPWGGVQPYLRDIYERVGGPRPSSSTSPVAAGVLPQGQRPISSIGGVEVDPFFMGPGGQTSRRPFEQTTVGGATGGSSGGGLIDQPLLISDPVGFMPAEEAAQQRMLDIAGQGVPGAVSAATSDLERTLGGGYLGADANPYLEGMYRASTRPVIEDFTEEVLPALTGQFAQAGRLGSGMQAAVQRGATEDLTRNLSDTAAQLYGGAYESERDRMLRSAALAPAVGTLERNVALQNAELMSGVGGARRELLEAYNQAAEARSREPWERLGLAAQLYGSGSPFVTESQPYYRNKTAGALGSGLSGAALGAQVGGPYGAAIGGAAGLVLGGLL